MSDTPIYFPRYIHGMNQIETATIKNVIAGLEEGRSIREIELNLTEVLSSIVREGKITNQEFGAQLRLVEQLKTTYEIEGLEVVKAMVARW